MEQFFSPILDLPLIARGALFGGIGGVLGSSIGYFIAQFSHSERISKAIKIGFTVVFVVASSNLATYVKKERPGSSTVAELKKQRLFSVLFRLHPEAEKEMTDAMSAIMTGSARSDWFMKSQQASAQIVTKYFNKYLMSASADDTHRVLLRNVAVMQKFADRPSLCVGYYLGKPKFPKKDATVEFVNEEANLKADVIENAVKYPATLPYTVPTDELIQYIARAYRANGYNEDDLKKLAHVERLPPAEGCRVGMEFTNAIASLGPVQAAFIFKNFIAMSGQ